MMKKTNSNREIRDESIGKSVAAAVRNQATARRCLGDEQMAALVDNRLSGAERERCLAHIALCDDCLTVYSMTARSVANRPVQRSWASYLAPVAAIAAAVIAIVLWRQQPLVDVAQAPQTLADRRSLLSEDTEQSPESPLAASVILTKFIQANLLPLAQESGYGFSGGLPPEKAAFRIGAALVDLSAANNSGSTVERTRAAEHLAELLQLQTETATLAATVEKQQMSGQQAVELSRQIERLLPDTERLYALRLGVMIQAARLVDNSALGRILDRQVLNSVVAKLGPETITPPLHEALARIDDILAKRTASELDIKTMRRQLDSLVELF